MAARDTSTPEERDRLIAEALAHAEARDAVYRPPTDIEPTGRWRGPLGVVLLVLAGVLAVAPPSWLQGPPRPAVSAADAALGVRLTLALQAAQVEAFRHRTQRLPDGLEELGAALPGVRYVRSGERVYQLVAYDPDRRPVVWDSTRPPPDVRDVAATVLTRIDGP